MAAPATAPQERDPGIEFHDLAAIDPRLERICNAWPVLPEHIVLAIIALVDSAGGVEADRLRLPS